ncbi:MAG: hypothetical protein NZ778_00320 [Arenicellales bacterium]|nr:hypothetical protein [Arenicellales bacterium]
MDGLLENWLDETIGDGDAMVEVPRISMGAALYAAIANYRAPAWIQSPKNQIRSENHEKYDYSEHKE